MKELPARGRKKKTRKKEKKLTAVPRDATWFQGEPKRPRKGKCGSKNAQVGGLVRWSKWSAPVNAFGFRPDVILAFSCNAHPSIHYRRPIHPSILSIHIPARGPFVLCQAILIPIYHLFHGSSPFLSVCLASLLPSPYACLSFSFFFFAETLRLQLVSFPALRPLPFFVFIHHRPSTMDRLSLSFIGSISIRLRVFSCFSTATSKGQRRR